MANVVFIPLAVANGPFLPTPWDGWTGSANGAELPLGKLVPGPLSILTPTSIITALRDDTSGTHYGKLGVYVLDASDNITLNASNSYFSASISPYTGYDPYPGNGVFVPTSATDGILYWSSTNSNARITYYTNTPTTANANGDSLLYLGSNYDAAIEFERLGQSQDILMLARDASQNSFIANKSGSMVALNSPLNSQYTSSGSGLNSLSSFLDASGYCVIGWKRYYSGTTLDGNVKLTQSGGSYASLPPTYAFNGSTSSGFYVLSTVAGVSTVLYVVYDNTTHMIIGSAVFTITMGAGGSVNCAFGPIQPILAGLSILTLKVVVLDTATALFVFSDMTTSELKVSVVHIGGTTIVADPPVVVNTPVAGTQGTSVLQLLKLTATKVFLAYSTYLGAASGYTYTVKILNA